MSRAEKKAAQNEQYKQRFLNGFRELYDRGQTLATVADVTPLAAAQDEDYMRKRSFMTVLLTGRRAEELPADVNYPSKKGAQHIIGQLLKEGLIEAHNNALANHDFTASGDNSGGHLYSLVPEQPMACSQPDVAITT